VNEHERESLFFSAHADTRAEVAVVPRRALPRHRARTRPHWKPSLEPVQAQHADHGDTFVR
jgi:hypothetical protein